MSGSAQPGDILLFYRATGLSRLITWFTRSPFYHVGICAGNGLVVEARPRGVVVRDLSDPADGSTFVVISAPGGREAGEAALRWADSRVGSRYDVFGAASIVLETVFKRLRLNYAAGSRFTCGELVTQAYLHAGVDLFNGHDPERILPRYFARFLPPLLEDRLREQARLLSLRRSPGPAA